MYIYNSILPNNYTFFLQKQCTLFLFNTSLSILSLLKYGLNNCYYISNFTDIKDCDAILIIQHCMELWQLFFYSTSVLAASQLQDFYNITLLNFTAHMPFTHTILECIPVTEYQNVTEHLKIMQSQILKICVYIYMYILLDTFQSPV